MAELRSTPPVAHENTFLFKPAPSRSVLRLKSWQTPRPGAPLVLGGSVLPDTVGTGTQGLPRVLCTAPGEWLMVYAPTGIARLRTILAPDLETQGLTLVDLTDGLSVLQLAGTGVREVLSRSCGLDFDPRRFGVGRCARTRFAQIPVVIDCVQEFGVFELYAPRSYAAYLKNWLQDAAVHIAGPST